MRSILVIASAALLAGCGLKGPLYLPPPVAAPQSTPPPQAPAAPPAERPTERTFPDVPSTRDKQ